MLFVVDIPFGARCLYAITAKFSLITYLQVKLCVIKVGSSMCVCPCIKANPTV